jgi:hypothetical protein
MLPSAGTEWARAHHSAEKNAPKNMTSEKMNQLMLQRNDRSILRPYCPPSLSPMASLNHWYSTPRNHSSPKAASTCPSRPVDPLAGAQDHQNSPRAAMAGCRDGAGTK